MAQTKKRPQTKIKELAEDLHYHQMMNRVDLASYRLGAKKVKQIAAEMRKLQKTSHKERE